MTAEERQIVYSYALIQNAKEMLDQADNILTANSSNTELLHIRNDVRNALKYVENADGEIYIAVARATQYSDPF